MQMMKLDTRDYALLIGASVVIYTGTMIHPALPPLLIGVLLCVWAMFGSSALPHNTVHRADDEDEAYGE